MECYNAGLPAVTCRMKLKHLGCSVKIRESTINTGNYEEKSGVAQTCKEYGLPECCTQLVSLTIRHMHPSMQPATKKEQENKVIQDYATGYLIDFSEDKFSKWIQSFECQTQTEYCVQRGGYKNQECPNGLINWKGEVIKYTIKWSQAYQCKRGGKSRTRPNVEVKRNAPGSTKMGCTATLLARLLSTEKGEVLEVTVPRYSAHCGHEVGSIPDLLTHKPLPEIENKVETLVRHSWVSQISLQLALSDWIKTELIPEHLRNGTLTHSPQEHDRRYFPTSKDLRVMSRKALNKIRNGLFDQDAVEVYLKKKQQSDPSFKFFLQKYKSTENTDQQQESR